MTAPMVIGLPLDALLPVVVALPLALVVVLLLLLLDPQPATTTAGTASAHSATAHALILLMESPFRCARDPPLGRAAPRWRVVLR